MIRNCTSFRGRILPRSLSSLLYHDRLRKAIGYFYFKLSRGNESFVARHIERMSARADDLLSVYMDMIPRFRRIQEKPHDFLVSLLARLFVICKYFIPFADLLYLFVTSGSKHKRSGGKTLRPVLVGYRSYVRKYQSPLPYIF